MSALPPEERVTRALTAVCRGDSCAGEELIGSLYDELRELARYKLARLPQGQTLQATALVHEAWMRVGGPEDPAWDGRAHFFGAAAQAMRNILVEQARRKAAKKRTPSDTPENAFVIEPPADNIIALHDALTRYEQEDERAAEVVKLRFFAGLSVAEVADVLGVSVGTVERDWRFARSWLERAVAGLPEDEN